MNTPATINVPELIDEQKVGSFQIRILVLCAAAVMLDGFAAQMIGYVAPSLAREMHLSPAALSGIFAWGLFGLMLGALSFGPIADRFGRKRVIVLCTLFYGVLSLASVLAHSAASLTWLRFIAGLGFGGVMPNSIALMAEYAPHRRRGMLVTMVICGFPIGAMIVGFAAVPILSVFGWRGVFVLGGILPLVLAPILATLLPESIRHLVIHGAEPSTIRELLARLFPDLRFAGSAAFVAREERAPGSPVAHLLRHGRAVSTLLLWIAFFVSLLDIFLLSNWLPTVFHDAGITLSLSVIATALFQGGGVLASLVLGTAVDRFGVFRAVSAIYVLGAIFVALLGYCHSAALIFGCTFLAGAGIVGGQTGANLLAASLYPTYIRSTGVGWALGVGRIGSIVGPVIGGIMVALHWPLTAIFLAAALPAFIGGISILLMERVQAPVDAEATISAATS